MDMDLSMWLQIWYKRILKVGCILHTTTLLPDTRQPESRQTTHSRLVHHLESEVRGEASALVVPPDEVDVIGVCYLEREKVQQYLARELATIHVVPQEEVA